MTDTYGPTSCEPFAVYDPDSSSWRMWRAISLWGSVEFSATWPKRGMTHAGHAYELPTSAPATAENGYSSLPTPHGGGALLPTPMTAYTATSVDEWRARRPAGNGATREAVGDLRLVLEEVLPSAPTLLPTPTANQPGGSAEQHLARKNRMPDGATRTSVTDLRMALELLPTPNAGQFNYDEDPERWQARRDRHASKPTNSTRAGLPLGVAVKMASGTTSQPSTDGPPSLEDQPLPGLTGSD